MAYGTVTGKNTRIYMVSHNAGAAPEWNMTNAIGEESYDSLMMGEFTLTVSRDTLEVPLVGAAGAFKALGIMSCEGSMTIRKFGNKYDMFLRNLIDTGDNQPSYRYIGISGCICKSSNDPNYLGFYLASCQFTNMDVTIGDAGTVTEASLDFINACPYAMVYDRPSGKIRG
jgi:hypothetical protein